MTLDQLIKKYDGEHVDYDYAFGPQCMDLYRKYVEEVLVLPQSISVEGAKEVWKTYPDDVYDRFINTPKAVPKKGDIIIWDKSVGKGFGHIAIFVHGNVKSFISFDQNWPVDSPCHLQQHGYSNIIGWLRVKKTSFDIRTMFRDVWKRKAARGEELYFIKRIGKGSIKHTEKDIINKMKYWREVVYPHGKYSLFGDLRWQIEKTKVLLGM
ncbi:MAG: CHAP domain-containing protein [Nitrosopumilus sp.]